MGFIRLLVTGAAVVAGVRYATKKRPDGTTFAGDLKAKAPDWMKEIQSYVARVDERFAGIAHMKGNTSNSRGYPQKFENSSPDPDPTYSS